MIPIPVPIPGPIRPNGPAVLEWTLDPDQESRMEVQEEVQEEVEVTRGDRQKAESQVAVIEDEGMIVCD